MEWAREWRRDWRTKWQKEKKKQDGRGEAVEGCKEGRSAAALLLQAIICSDML